jgi:hypothetical protein
MTADKITPIPAGQDAEEFYRCRRAMAMETYVEMAVRH